MSEAQDQHDATSPNLTYDEGDILEDELLGPTDFWLEVGIEDENFPDDEDPFGSGEPSEEHNFETLPETNEFELEESDEEITHELHGETCPDDAFFFETDDDNALENSFEKQDEDEDDESSDSQSRNKFHKERKGEELAFSRESLKANAVPRDLTAKTDYTACKRQDKISPSQVMQHPPSFGKPSHNEHTSLKQKPLLNFPKEPISRSRHLTNHVHPRPSVYHAFQQEPRSSVPTQHRVQPQTYSADIVLKQKTPLLPLPTEHRAFSRQSNGSPVPKPMHHHDDTQETYDWRQNEYMATASHSVTKPNSLESHNDMSHARHGIPLLSDCFQRSNFVHSKTYAHGRERSDMREVRFLHQKSRSENDASVIVSHENDLAYEILSDMLETVKSVGKQYLSQEDGEGNHEEQNQQYPSTSQPSYARASDDIMHPSTAEVRAQVLYHPDLRAAIQKNKRFTQNEDPELHGALCPPQQQQQQCLLTHKTIHAPFQSLQDQEYIQEERFSHAVSGDKPAITPAIPVQEIKREFLHLCRPKVPFVTEYKQKPIQDKRFLANQGNKVLHTDPTNDFKSSFLQDRAVAKKPAISQVRKRFPLQQVRARPKGCDFSSDTSACAEKLIPQLESPHKHYITHKTLEDKNEMTSARALTDKKLFIGQNVIMQPEILQSISQTQIAFASKCSSDTYQDFFMMNSGTEADEDEISTQCDTRSFLVNHETHETIKIEDGEENEISSQSNISYQNSKKALKFTGDVRIVQVVTPKPEDWTANDSSPTLEYGCVKDNTNLEVDSNGNVVCDTDADIEMEDKDGNQCSATRECLATSECLATVEIKTPDAVVDKGELDKSVVEKKFVRRNTANTNVSIFQHLAAEYPDDEGDVKPVQITTKPVSEKLRKHEELRKQYLERKEARRNAAINARARGDVVSDDCLSNIPNKVARQDAKVGFMLTKSGSRLQHGVLPTNSGQNQLMAAKIRQEMLGD